MLPREFMACHEPAPGDCKCAQEELGEGPLDMMAADCERPEEGRVERGADNG